MKYLEEKITLDLYYSHAISIRRVSSPESPLDQVFPAVPKSIQGVQCNVLGNYVNFANPLASYSPFSSI